MTAKPFCDGPFSILKGTNWIVGKDHHGEPCHVLDQRGWGYLTGKGHTALALDPTTASELQANMQQWVVDALNAAWNRRADLAAVHPAQVRVKPLVWDAENEARGAGCLYTVWGDRDFKVSVNGSVLGGIRYGAYIKVFNSIEAAKAAAQADYEARILAAIEPQPDPRDAQIAALVEAAEAANVMMGNLIDVMGTPDVQMCCNGYMCGCQGVTVYDEAEHYARQSIAQLSAAIAAAKGGV